jgi:hypothetical protein
MSAMGALAAMGLLVRRSEAAHDDTSGSLPAR